VIYMLNKIEFQDATIISGRRTTKLLSKEINMSQQLLGWNYVVSLKCIKNYFSVSKNVAGKIMKYLIRHDNRYKDEYEGKRRIRLRKQRELKRLNQHFKADIAAEKAGIFFNNVHQISNKARNLGYVKGGYVEHNEDYSKEHNEGLLLLLNINRSPVSSI